MKNAIVLAMDDLQVLILAGGKGTRLQPVISDIPKPMAPIRDLPFLEYLVRYLVNQNLKHICFLTGYKGSIVEEYFRHSKLAHFTYSHEESPLGTGGAVGKAVNNSTFSKFLVINGDTFFRLDYSYFLECCKKSNTPCALALRYSTDLTRYGKVEFNTDYKVNSFIEKDSADGIDGFINGGVYYLDQSISNMIPQGVCSLETEIFPELAKQNLLSGFPIGGAFIDIGIPDDYQSAQESIPNWVSFNPKPALFLDRDGILIKDTHYLKHTEEVEIDPDMGQCLKTVQDKGVHLYIVSNQAGVAKGKLTIEDLKKINTYVEETYRSKFGVTFKAVMTCPYHEEGTIPPFNVISYARKPECGMHMLIQDTDSINISQSLMVGDKDSDEVKVPNLTTYLLENQYKISSTTAKTFKSIRDLADAIKDYFL